MNNNTGLTDKEVEMNRKKYGINKLSNKKKKTLLNLILESLNDPIIKILLIALCIKFLFMFQDENVYETLGIAISVFLASFISALSEYGSEKAFERLSEENSNIKIKVIRNSKRTIVNIEDIVVNDIVILNSGDRVPGDAVILEGELYLDESSLTGETIEKYKGINEEIYMGSVICEGNAIVIINKVGDNTYYGKIAQIVQENNNSSPLKEKLTDLAKIISRFGYIGAFLVFISYILNAVIIPNNYNLSIILDFKILIPHLIYALTLSVAVIVMAVPEGLPMMITLVLSSNMKRLINKNVLVRKLVGIETSGSLNILFTDKTGTLTEGKLKMLEFLTPTFKSYKNINELKKDYNYELIYESLIYNNDSFFVDGKIEGGNQTDKTILEFFNSDDKSKYKIIEKEPFNSKLKYSTVTTNYNNKTTYYKGAYEILLDKCNYYLDEYGNKRYIYNKEELISKIRDITSTGMRVLCTCAFIDNKYCLLGFILLKDSIRKDAYEGINEIKSSGVQIVMVTGDARETAISVAKDLKIIENDSDIVLTSEEFNKLSDEEIKKILNNLKVLSRSLPDDKNRLVRIANELDLVTGMTGDGVNDAPALKKASVGFSMGSGSEIAKETSDIVIIDNDIKSIATAILYGRTIYKSIRKFITFQLSVNCCTVLLSIISPFIGILSPITVVQVLWVNMVMDTFAGLAFSFEPAIKQYMKEKPKSKNERIINSYMKNQIMYNGIFSMFLCIWFLKSPFIHSLYRYDINDKYLMTAFFGLFIFLDIFNAFCSRTPKINTFSNIFKNKVFLLTFLFISIVQILLIYYGGYIFRTTGLTIYEFEIMIIISSLIIPFDIFRKIILKRKRVNMGF